eukprot:CAMPEP_0196797204 /NCGR_PEP_ID=MMETSP1104-20130614/38523_1 /TAXON_ID=33652 /ORGANISM="Cafeteria sp., Strain Caron Lab Isolate" /LENGTH=577 /DNA_ID=CAMNT_0042167609 /DNA_START=59 /DNA_END=1789 /DNA_ORIENTATION=-
MSGAELLSAAGAGNFAVSKSLLDRGADPNVRGAAGETPLHWACLKGHLELARLLVSRGADIRALDRNGRTPAQLATEQGQAKVAKAMDAIEERNRKLWTAASGGDDKACKKLLAGGVFKKSAYVSSRDEWGWTALHMAAAHGHAAVARVLVDRGADAGSRSTRERDGIPAGATAADIARHGGRTAVLRALPGGNFIRVGAEVRVHPNPAHVQALSDGHGGWNDRMAGYCGRLGTVREIDSDGDVVVQFSDGKRWFYNPDALLPPDFDISSLPSGGAVSGSLSSRGAGSISVGARVRVHPDARHVQRLNEGHGGWNDRMAEYCGRVGTLHQIDGDGDAAVSFSDGRRWFYNPAALSPAGPPASVGMSVRVVPDAGMVQRLAEGFGGWNSDMASYCGRIGRVDSVRDSGALRVQFAGGQKWLFNPDVLMGVSGAHDDGMAVGARVRVIPDAAEVKRLSEGHGGWNDRMAEYCGRIGTVADVDSDGDMSVVFSDSQKWLFNPAALVPAGPPASVGMSVRVVPDAGMVQRLAEGFGGWNSDMASYCGRIGRVDSVRDSGALRVEFAGGQKWLFNPDVLMGV